MERVRRAPSLPGRVARSVAVRKANEAAPIRRACDKLCVSSATESSTLGAVRVIFRPFA